MAAILNLIKFNANIPVMDKDICTKVVQRCNAATWRGQRDGKRIRKLIHVTSSGKLREQKCVDLRH